MNIGILILAAGKSERFQRTGGEGSKLNYRIDQQTVFEKTLINSMNSELPIHVITRADNVGVINNCLHFNISFSVLNSHGLGESIALGVKNTSNWSGWLIQLGDMPYISHEIFIRVANELKNYSLVRPVYKNIPGHPVGISEKHRQNLLNLSGDDGAKSILRHQLVYEMQINDENVIKDIDYLPNKN